MGSKCNWVYSHLSSGKILGRESSAFWENIKNHRGTSSKDYDTSICWECKTAEAEPEDDKPEPSIPEI